MAVKKRDQLRTALEEVSAAAAAVDQVLQQHMAAVRRRDDAIRAAFEAGATGYDIAVAAGLSRDRAYQIRDRRR